jgi:glycosyltransferase involved in cell wall biosynthesis
MTTYLFDATTYNSAGRPFGIARYAYQLTLAFDRIKSELAPDERLVAAVRLRGVDAVTEDLRMDRHVDPVPLSYAAYRRGRRRDLGRTLECARPDLVHMVEGPQTLPHLRIPTVVTCQDLIPILYPDDYLSGPRTVFRRRLHDYWSYWNARRVIAISQTTAAALVTILQLPRERITVIPHGVDHEQFNPKSAPGERDAIRRVYGLPARYALYVGATDPRKRVDLLIARYQQVFRATGVPLALVGTAFPRAKDAATRRALAAAAPGSTLSIGEVPPGDLPALYRQAEVHVQPSAYEGFGLTVLEAMACGCPVIATTGGAVPEVVGDAAPLVSPNDGPALESAIVELLGNAAARDRLRARGIERAGHFSWDRTARETLALYRRASGRIVTRPANRFSEDRASEQRQQP